MNQVSIIANLVRDPESFPMGEKQIAKFTVALRGRSDKDPTFIDVEAFNQVADIVMNHLQKGSKIGLNAYLKQDRWQSKDGQARTKIKLIARDVTFLDRIKSPEGNGEVQENVAEQQEAVPF